ncbi:MAG: hypothetical protein QMD36_02220 [Candidatus Aenigmarchaeota archaeon]|nr:hypothetical protein [Candidatus Aenigmarchaeota archaeon]
MRKAKNIQKIILFIIIILIIIFIISIFFNQFLGPQLIEPPPVPESVGIPLP